MTDAPTPTDSGPVHLDFRKHDGREHWQEPYRLLGVDRFGVWLGMPVGTAYGRPGVDLVSEVPIVRLLPAADLPGGPRWAACFNGRPEHGGERAIRVYVDVCTAPVWRRTGDGWRATLVDMDLDIVQRFDGDLFIDDEDEFVEHTALFGYDAALVAATRAAADAVFARVRDGEAPFDGTGERHLADCR
ncbi:DUF402 domain-containing protein [Aestuariimicrobium soli]|uniref:DUF402 domain-containing protein n=1 Tax=Aestuariimicrobium soli TaxID=2035834 RepID=UPI003EBC2CB2